MTGFPDMTVDQLVEHFTATAAVCTKSSSFRNAPATARGYPRDRQHFDMGCTIETLDRERS
jgi:hypothetical protein